MAPTRSRQRASNPGPSHVAPPYPALISLIEILLKATPSPPSQLTNSLHSLKLNPASLPFQLQVANSLPHPPFPPALNLLFSHLTLYHSHSPDSSLPLLSSNLALPTTPPLLPSLASLSLLTRDPPPQLKSALLHHLPSLLPPLHYLLLHSATISPSLTILLNLSSAHPQSLLPYWSLFLPPSKSLTDLLHSPNHTLRSHAISTLHNFISGARQLLRNLPLSHTTSSNAFTSTGLRALRATRALHLILAEALRHESDGVVLAKLSKLAALLFNCVSYPSVHAKHINPLMTALRACVFAEGRPDLTSRSAAAVAMAAGLKKSGQVIEGVDNLCEEVVRALENEEEEPLVELLGVLRGVIRVKGTLFARVWEKIGEKLVRLASSGKGESLHCVRLSETWLEGAVKRALTFKQKDNQVSGITSSAEELTLAWEVHEKVLREAACNGGEKVQAEAVAAMESLLRLTDCVGEMMDWKIDEAIENGVPAGCKQVMLKVLEVAGMLEEYALSEYGIRVRIAALRSLASVPVGYRGKELLWSVLRCFHEVSRKEENGNGVRGKAMTAAATVMDRAVSAETEIRAEVRLIFRDITNHAVKLLQMHEHIHMGEQSAATRANVESSRISAINMIACSLRIYDQVQSSPDVGNAVNEQTNALSQVLQDDTSVNVQCICAKAIEQVLTSNCSYLGKLISSPERILLRGTLESSLDMGDVRLQMACAQVLTKLPTEEPGASDPFHSLFLFASVYEKSTCRMQSENDHTENNKRLLLSLQDVLSEHIYKVVAELSEDLLKEKCVTWAASKSLNVNKILIDAVFHHLSIPRHLAEYMREPGVRTLTSARERSGQLFLSSLNAESRITVMKVLRLDSQNG